MKIVITGGHLTPALALIQELVKHDHRIVFIGRTLTSKDLNIPSKEQDEVEALGCRFVPFSAPKLSRHKLLASLATLPQLLPSFFKARKILSTHRPDILVSFGGYLAVPLALAAATLDIPIITHEQTTQAGLANRLIARVATKVALSFPSSKKYYPLKKSVITGNPIRHSFVQSTKKPSWLTSDRPFLYLTGGNQGSHILNNALVKLLPQLLPSFAIVMQTGTIHEADIRREIESLSLSFEERERLFVRPWFEENEAAFLIRHAHVVISRAGANTVTELMVSSTPAILIPLATAQKQEQLKNALHITKKRAGLLIQQSRLNAETLLKAINDITQNYPLFKEAAEAIDGSVHRGAAKALHQLVHKISKDS